MLFPEAVISRITTSVSSSYSMPSASSCFFTPSCPLMLKKASTLAFGLPDEISSRFALSPRIRLTLSTIIDFPAPVSPVKTFSPAPSSKSRCSISAIFRIINRSSILPSSRAGSIQPLSDEAKNISLFCSDESNLFIAS